MRFSVVLKLEGYIGIYIVLEAICLTAALNSSVFITANIMVLCVVLVFNVDNSMFMITITFGDTIFHSLVTCNCIHLTFLGQEHLPL